MRGLVVFQTNGTSLMVLGLYTADCQYVCGIAKRQVLTYPNIAANCGRHKGTYAYGFMNV